MGKRKHGEQTGDVIRVIEILRKKVFKLLEIKNNVTKIKKVPLWI